MMNGNGHVSQEGVSRREMIMGVSRVAAGAAILSGGAAKLAAPAATSLAEPLTAWGYRKLDPAGTAALAYENWYKNYCCYAVASSIIDQLREQIGGPYNNLPVEGFVFGHGGTVGWGTLCGTLMGAGLAASFAAGKEGENILNDVIAWYGDTQLPIFTPVNARTAIHQVNASGSPLCHVSVGKWMKKEGVSLASPERKDRCARVAADVAFHTVTLLNQWADGEFRMQHGSLATENGATSRHNCLAYHGDNMPIPNI